MEAVNLIRKKRDGGGFTPDEIRFLIDGYVSGRVPDYQISSLLMAIFFMGMTFEETGVLTQCMLESGDRWDLSSLDKPLVDKHSTGGVGDKVSLILAPLAASCGLYVPMMSGRSLGHTGGTLDKLESIPGFNTDLSLGKFIECIEKTGYGLVGQSESIVPADRLLYALRDASATVESIPLITASILSKKIAEGSESIVFDVKVGSGAFMKNRDDARKLASSLVRTAGTMGKRAAAVLTDMNQPLGRTVGNFLEIREVIECLRGEGPQDLMEVTLHLTARMLVLGGITKDMEAANAVCDLKLKDGSAWASFLGNTEFQGGDIKVLENPDKGPSAAIERPVLAQSDGFVSHVDAYPIGMAATLLGAGRIVMDAPVLPGVGIVLERKAGQAVSKGDVLCRIHSNSEEGAEKVMKMVESAFKLSTQKPAPQSMVLEEILDGME